ncbi:MAG: DNA alkylation repair protein [Bacteroidetes bacterium]|nr:MAG: DNA alkylation repair protein [Bacteroidota bacterium]
MSTLQQLKSALLSKSDQKKKAGELERFFQAYPGGYGEGDTFLGVRVPDQRAIAKTFFREITLDETAQLLQENIHEHRLTAVFMLVLKYEKARSEEDKKAAVETYLQNIAGINNWDLVDSSSYKILGPWLLDKDKRLLYEYANSGQLWLQRIAMITTMHFIRNHRYDDALRLAEILLNHPHDLMHKAVGWMLREIGNRDYDTEYTFLQKHYQQMPRTALRYAIEKFDEPVRQGFLKGEI